MKLNDQIAAMDAIVRDLFASGGPMRPANGGKAVRWKGGGGKTGHPWSCGCPACVAEADSYLIKSKSDPVLVAEKKRLMRTWKGLK